MAKSEISPTVATYEITRAVLLALRRYPKRLVKREARGDVLLRVAPGWTFKDVAARSIDEARERYFNPVAADMARLIRREGLHVFRHIQMPARGARTVRVTDRRFSLSAIEHYDIRQDRNKLRFYVAGRPGRRSRVKVPA